AARRREAVERLFVKHHRDAQPGVLDDPALHGIGVFGLRARAALPRSPGRTGDLAGTRDLTETGAEHGTGLRRVEAAVAVLNLILPDPDALELCDFFFERHPPEQVGDALVEGPC